MTHFASHYRWLVMDRYLRLDMRGVAVLDVGCSAAYLLSQLGASIAVGVDIEPGAAPPPGVLYVQADAQSLPFVDRRFDRVLALELVEHLESPSQFIAEAGRLLAPGGVLWFSTPSDKYGLSPWFMTRVMENRWGHRRRGFRRSELQALVPTGCTVTILPWNEPIFRRLYLLAKTLSLFSSSLACRFAAACASLDNRFRAGDSGRFFVRIQVEG